MKLPKILIVFTVCLLIVVFGFLGSKWLKSSLFILEIVPNNPIKPLSLFVADPKVERINYQMGRESIHADLWKPEKEGKYPGVVLHLGVDIDKNDQRVIRMAKALTRSGYVVLVPNISSLFHRRLLVDDKEEFIKAFEVLEQQPNVNSEKTGFIGFCASAGLVLMAAADSTIASEVDFVLSINPIYDFSTFSKAVTTWKIQDGENSLDWQPHFKTTEMFRRENIEFLTDLEERKLLTNNLVNIGQEKLKKGEFLPLSDAEVKNLSPEALFTYRSLINKDTQNFDKYLEEANPRQKQAVSELSPKSYIKNLKAKVFVLSDLKNTYIPFTEAKELGRNFKERRVFYGETNLLPGTEKETDWIFYLNPKEWLKMILFVDNFLR